MTVITEAEYTRYVEGEESGDVASGDQGTLIFDSLADGAALEIYKAIFMLSDGTAIPSSVDLTIATLANDGTYTNRVTIYTGDGTTIWDGDPANSVGNPLASWTNSTGSRQTVALLADNASGNLQNIMSKAWGKKVV